MLAVKLQKKQRISTNEVENPGKESKKIKDLSTVGIVRKDLRRKVPDKSVALLLLTSSGVQDLLKYLGREF